jgi:putative transcriptional regulator
MITPAAGILLISDPFLKDPNFMRTVVLLCEHQDEGSFGFVLNRPFEHSLNELIPELENHTLPVFYGGPVQADTIHFLHQYPNVVPGGVEVLKGVYWGGDFRKLIQLIISGKVSADKIRFFIGYSGWSDGQLNNELKEKSWLTVTGTRKLVFHKNTSEIWKDALKHMGGEFEALINYPIDPQLN